MKAPTPIVIRKARVHADLNYAQAAAPLYYGYRAWMQWEAGTRTMHPALWELWNLKVLGKGRGGK